MTPEEIAAYNVDKSAWSRGPWDSEADRVDFESAGLPCLMLRSELTGTWCGYVAVPPGHPAFGKGYEDVDANVHGGLTYAAECRGNICHVPAPGEPDRVWWFGFDCAHAGDQCPAIEATLRSAGLPPRPLAPFGLRDRYRTTEYVRRNVVRLAKQLRAMV